MSRFVLLALVGVVGLSLDLQAADSGGTSEAMLRARIAAIESRVGGGRLGVALLDTETGERIGYRSDERFPMCSTFKFLLAAAVLHRVQHEQERLDRIITYNEADLLEHAPVTKAHLHERGMTVVALCAAAIQQSDNTAANLLLATIGGPAGLTDYVRSLGDEVTRLDRNEPELNRVSPGDPRDTTAPAEMLANLQRLLLGDALAEEFRAQLESWLVGNTTGANLIRAAVPPTWRVGDKTGRGDNGSVNDIAILRPPDRAPILLCIYFTGSTASAKDREAAIAESARIVVEAFR